jgi:hypothetical protein
VVRVQDVSVRTTLGCVSGQDVSVVIEWFVCRMCQCLSTFALYRHYRENFSECVPW